MIRLSEMVCWFGLLLVAGCLSGCTRNVAEAIVTDTDNARQIRDAVEAGAGSGVVVSSSQEPTGFATLRGMVQLDTAVSPLKGIPFNTLGDDALACSPGKTDMANNALQVGADNGLANVAIWLTKPRKVPENPKWIHEDYQATRDAELTGKEAGFDQENCVFVSRMFAMRSTQKLEILNSDRILHNTKIEGDAGGGAAGANSAVSGGGKVMYEPQGYSNQPFKVSCSIHGFMQAWMLVRQDPFFAVSGLDGGFDIANIPAGVDLEFRLSHEGTFLDGKRVKATRNEQPLTIKSGRIKLSGIEPGDVVELKFVLDTKAYGWAK